MHNLSNNINIGENRGEKRSSRGARLAEFYELKGLKRAAFAQLLGVPYDNLSKWINDKHDPPAWFWRLLKEKYPDVDIGYILTGLKSVPLPVEGRKVPIFAKVPAGRLNFSFAEPDTEEWTMTDNEKDKELFALYVKGDSMYPELWDGDLVFCAPQRSFINGENYVIVTDDSEATIKKVYKAPGGYDLQPVNPDYERVFLSEEKVIRLILVVDMKRRYRR